MKIIGITGGIGSGKTRVSKFITEAGYPVYFADDRAREIMNESEKIKAYLIKEYGKGIYIKNQLNRSLLASIVFKKNKALENLNKIVHPEIFLDFERWKTQQTQEFVFKEAAILFESGSYRFSDFNVTVEADEELRIERVMRRNHFTRAQVLERMANQWSSQQRQEKADYILWNNGSLVDLEKVTGEFLLFLSKKWN